LEGRSLRQTAAAADGFNSSIGVDGRMFREDIAAAWPTRPCSRPRA
jgi:hypothetical protein